MADIVRPTNVPVTSINTTSSLTLLRRHRLASLLNAYEPLRDVFPGKILSFPVSTASEDEGVRVALWSPARHAKTATAGGSTVTHPNLPPGATGKTDIEVHLALTILVHLKPDANEQTSNIAYEAMAAVGDAFLLALIAHISDPAERGRRLWHKLELMPNTTEFSREEGKGCLRSDTGLRLHTQIQNP